MLDRVPTYPGRVQLTPVSGQTDVYDLTMADEATVTGTPLNKANLLTDATASAIQALEKGSTPSTPNEALNLLAEAIAAGVKLQSGSYVGTGTYGSANANSLTFDFTPKAVFVGTYQVMVYLWGNSGVTYAWASNANALMGISTSGNTMSWYSGSSAEAQMNLSNTTYRYIAIG